MEDIKEICNRIFELEGELIYGRVAFTSDKLMSAMGCCHPSNMLNTILAPVWYASKPEIGKVEEMYSSLVSFNNSYNIYELKSILEDLRIYLQENGVTVKAPEE